MRISKRASIIREREIIYAGHRKRSETHQKANGINSDDARVCMYTYIYRNVGQRRRAAKGRERETAYIYAAREKN